MAWGKKKKRWEVNKRRTLNGRQALTNTLSLEQLSSHLPLVHLGSDALRPRPHLRAAQLARGANERWADSFVLLCRPPHPVVIKAGFVRWVVGEKLSLFFPTGGVQSLGEFGLSRRHVKGGFPTGYLLNQVGLIHFNGTVLGLQSRLPVGSLLVSGSQGHFDFIRALKCGYFCISWYIFFTFLALNVWLGPLSGVFPCCIPFVLYVASERLFEPGSTSC